jgi:hypothetical protein
LDAFGVHDELVGLLAVHFCHSIIRSRPCIFCDLFVQMYSWPLHCDTKSARQSVNFGCAAKTPSSRAFWPSYQANINFTSSEPRLTCTAISAYRYMLHHHLDTNSRCRIGRWHDKVMIVLSSCDR